MPCSSTPTDGHSLFRHVSAWSDTVDAFLVAHQLNPLPQPFPEIQAPNVPPPPGLSESGQHAFESWLLLGPHKAFATSPHSFGFSTAQMTIDDARHKALDNCRHSAHAGEDCIVVSLDNAAVQP